MPLTYQEMTSIVSASNGKSEPQSESWREPQPVPVPSKHTTIRATIHSEWQNNHSDITRDIIIGFADGLTVPFALTAGLSSYFPSPQAKKNPFPIPTPQNIDSHNKLSPTDSAHPNS